VVAEAGGAAASPYVAAVIAARANMRSLGIDRDLSVVIVCSFEAGGPPW
jgi:hypothetical protein